MTISLTKWDRTTSNQTIVPLQMDLFANWWYWKILTIRRKLVAWNIDDSSSWFSIGINASSELLDLRLQRYSSTDYCQNFIIYEQGTDSGDDWPLILFLFNSEATNMSQLGECRSWFTEWDKIKIETMCRCEYICLQTWRLYGNPPWIDGDYDHDIWIWRMYLQSYPAFIYSGIIALVTFTHLRVVWRDAAWLTYRGQTYWLEWSDSPFYLRGFTSVRVTSFESRFLTSKNESSSVTSHHSQNEYKSH